MRTSYPSDESKLPKTQLAMFGSFNVRYQAGLDQASGWLKSDTTKNEKRRYVFEVTWKNGKPHSVVSVANPDLGVDFDVRDTRDGKFIYRELKGLPRTNRKDLHEYACRIGEAVRKTYIEDYDFLSQRVEQNALEIGRVTKGLTEKILFQDGDWLISKRQTVRGAHLSAERIANPEGFTAAVEKMKENAANYEKHKHLYERNDDDPSE